MDSYGEESNPLSRWASRLTELWSRGYMRWSGADSWSARSLPAAQSSVWAGKQAGTEWSFTPGKEYLVHGGRVLCRGDDLLSELLGSAFDEAAQQRIGQRWVEIPIQRWRATGPRRPTDAALKNTEDAEEIRLIGGRDAADGGLIVLLEVNGNIVEIRIDHGGDVQFIAVCGPDFGTAGGLQWTPWLEIAYDLPDDAVPQVAEQETIALSELLPERVLAPQTSEPAPNDEAVHPEPAVLVDLLDLGNALWVVALPRTQDPGVLDVCGVSVRMGRLQGSVTSRAGE